MNKEVFFVDLTILESILYFFKIKLVFGAENE